MIDFITEIFIESGFEVKKQITNYNVPNKMYFARREKEEKFDFYLVISIKEESLEINQIKQISNHFLESVLENNNIPGLDKNISLLLLVERKTMSFTEDFNKKVFDFEEDPFNFKKYILPYTSEQLQLLKDKLNPNEKVIKQLDKILNNKKYFNEFKENVEYLGSSIAKTYDLTSKVFIKLPFLKSKINKEDLPDISRSIESSISLKDKKVIDIILGIENSNITWHNILNALEEKSDEL